MLPWERLCYRGALVAGGGEVAGEGGKPWRTLSEVVPGLLLTCEAELRDRARCAARDVVLVVNLCASPDAPPYAVWHARTAAGAEEPLASLEALVHALDAYLAQWPSSHEVARRVFVCNVAAEDTPSYDLSRHFAVTNALLSLVLSHRDALRDSTVRLPSVGVHCMLGVSRSVAVVMAFLMHAAALSRDAALAFVRSVRPVANPNVGFLQQLALYEQLGCVRLASAFDADAFAHTLRHLACNDDNDAQLVAALRAFFDTCVHSSRCASERAYTGRALHRALATATSQRRRRVVCDVLHTCVTTAVASEAYVDTPHLFDNIAQLLRSIADEASELLPLLHARDDDDDDNDDDVVVVWHDAMYAPLLAQLVRAHAATDVHGGARACGALLRALCGDAHRARPLLSYTLHHRRDDGTATHKDTVHYTLPTPLLRTSFVVVPLVCVFALDCAAVPRAVVDKCTLDRDTSHDTATIVQQHVRRAVDALLCRCSNDSSGGNSSSSDDHAGCVATAAIGHPLHLSCMHDDVELVSLARVACDGVTGVCDALTHMLTSTPTLPAPVACAVACKVVGGVLAYCVLSECAADVVCARTHDNNGDGGVDATTQHTQQQQVREQQLLRLRDVLRATVHTATTLLASRSGTDAAATRTAAPRLVTACVRRVLNVLRDAGVVSAHACSTLADAA